MYKNWKEKDVFLAGEINYVFQIIWNVLLIRFGLGFVFKIRPICLRLDQHCHEAYKIQLSSNILIYLSCALTRNTMSNSRYLWSLDSASSWKNKRMVTWKVKYFAIINLVMKCNEGRLYFTFKKDYRLWRITLEKEV